MELHECRNRNNGRTIVYILGTLSLSSFDHLDNHRLLGFINIIKILIIFNDVCVRMNKNHTN